MPEGRFTYLLVAALSVLLTLAACGGDDGEDEQPTATAEPESTATSSVEEPATSSPALDAGTPAASPASSSPVASPSAQGAATPQAMTQGATVVLTDYRVNLFQSTFAVGQAYTFVVENNGGVAHSFVIEAMGADNQPLEANGQRAEIAEIPAGGRATLTWTFTEPGEYQIACHRDDHFARGMVHDNIVVTG